MSRRKFADEELLGHIGEFVKRNGYPPTMREMADELGVHETTVRNGLLRLADEGRVELVPRTTRGVRILG